MQGEEDRRQLDSGCGSKRGRHRHSDMYIGNVVISQIYNIYISAKVFMFQLNKSRFLRVFSPQLE